MTTISDAAKATQDYFGFAQFRNLDPCDSDTRNAYLETIANNPAYTDKQRAHCAEQSRNVIETRLSIGQPAQPIRAKGDEGSEEPEITAHLANSLNTQYKAWCTENGRHPTDYVNVAEFLGSHTHAIELAAMTAVLPLVTSLMYSVWHRNYSRPNNFKERVASAWESIDNLHRTSHNFTELYTANMHLYTIIFTAESFIKDPIAPEVIIDGKPSSMTLARLRVLDDMVRSLRALREFYPKQPCLHKAIDEALVPFQHELREAFPEVDYPIPTFPERESFYDYHDDYDDYEEYC